MGKRDKFSEVAIIIFYPQRFFFKVFKHPSEVHFKFFVLNTRVTYYLLKEQRSVNVSW